VALTGVVRLAKESGGGCDRIVFCGHSLGGAMVHLTAIRMMDS
jgi:acetyl esterase/lipase